MIVRNLWLKGIFFPINQGRRNFGFLLSSTTSSSTSSKGNEELDALVNLSEKLKTRKLDSKYFFQKAKYTYNNLSSNLSQNTNVMSSKKIEKDINRFCSLLIDCIKYVSNQQILDIFNMIENGIKQSNYEKETLGDLIKWIIFAVDQNKITTEETEYYCNRIYTLLEEIKRKQSLNLYTYLLEANKYHETFEQEYIETMDKIIFDHENEIKFYNENIIDLERIQALLKAIRDKRKKIPSIYKVFDLFSLNKDMKYLNKNVEKSLNIHSKASQDITFQIAEYLSIIESPIESFTSKLYLLLELLKIYPEDEKDKLLSIISNQFTLYFEKEEMVSLEEFSKVIEFIYLFKQNAPKHIIQNLLSKVMNFFGKNINLFEELEFSQLMFLAINSNFYLKNIRGNNIIHLTLMKHITNRLNSITEVINVLPILLNYGIIPNELIRKLSTLDVSNRLKFSNIQMIYYIITYVRLYSKASGYNKIVFNGVKIIDELFEKIHSRFTFEEKCLIILQTKDFSSHNKNFYIMKPIIEEMDKIPQKYFAGVINSLVNSCYFLLDKDLLMSEITKRWDFLDHKDLILIGKALVWVNLGNESFWINFFSKLQKLVPKIPFENIVWVCNLHQIIYSLKLYNPELYQNIVSNFKDIDFEKIEKCYFERPKLITTDEITKSEFEIEQSLQEMDIPYIRQMIIGIHRVDFVITPKLIVELYGRHHFTERNVLNGTSTWRETQLVKLGYKVVGIILQDWNDLATVQRKKEYLKNKLNIHENSK